MNQIHKLDRNGVLSQRIRYLLLSTSTSTIRQHHTQSSQALAFFFNANSPLHPTSSGPCRLQGGCYRQPNHMNHMNHMNLTSVLAQAPHRPSQPCSRLPTQRRFFSTNDSGRKSKSNTDEMVSDILSVYLRKFFIKIHPDFFHSHPQLQSTNSKSLAALNAIIDYQVSYREEKQKDIIISNFPQAQKLTFYYFSTKDVLEDPEIISIDFDLAPIVEEGGSVDQYLNHLVYQLIEAAQIAVPEETRDILNDYWKEIEKVEKTRRHFRKHWGRKESLNERIERLYMEHLQKHPNAFLDQIKAEDALIPLMLHHKLIKFDQKLDTIAQTQGLRLLKFAVEDYYQSLRCESWARLRILISTRFQFHAQYLQIPYDFKAWDLIENVNQYFDMRKQVKSSKRS